MRVFVTGATGFIGSAVVPDLISAGHQVIGLSRSDAGAQALTKAGAQVHHGDLENLESLRSGAAKADGVVHIAFIHDLSKFKENCEIDRRAIETLGEALAGSDRPLVVSGGLFPTPGRTTTEDDAPPANSPTPRVSEETALALAARGVRASVIRLPQVHDTAKQGFITYMIAIARQTGVSAYIGDGLNRFPAVHLSDTAPLYRLALEKAPAAARYHAVAEEGVAAREIAEAIGRGLGVPAVSIPAAESHGHFGWLGMFMGMNLAASSALTQKRLAWHPTGPGLISDLDHMDYSKP